MRVSSNSIRHVFDYSVQELKAIYSAEEAASITRMLFEEYCGLDRAALALKKSETINESELLLIYDALKELGKFRPVQYVLGKASFCGLTFRVNPSVLIPRPETEEMVSLILKEKILLQENPAILDIGTGSGCIAITLKKELNNVQVTATDISTGALATAAVNASEHNALVTFIQSDIFKACDELPRDLSLIVSNPPYVREAEKTQMQANVLNYEPSSALFVPDNDPLKYYIAIFGLAASHLHPDGIVYAEINEQLSGETATLAQTYGFRAVVIRDLFGKDRFIRCKRI